MPERRITDIHPKLSGANQKPSADILGNVIVDNDPTTSSVFGGAVTDFILYGVVNGAFQYGPPDPTKPINDQVGDTEYNPMPTPGWTGPVQVSGSSIVVTWVADASSPSGYNLRFTINPGAAGDEAYMEQIVPIGGSRGQWQGHYPRLYIVGVSDSGGGHSKAYISVTYLNASGAVTGADPWASVNTGAAPGSHGLTFPQSVAPSPATDALYLRVRIGLKRDTLAAAGSAIVDFTDVRLDSAKPFVLVAEQTFPASYTPGPISQSSGVLRLAPNGSTNTIGITVSDSGTVTTPGANVCTGIIAVTISSNQNNYSPTGLATCSTMVVTASGANRTITGLDATSFTEGQILRIVTKTNSTILAHASASSSSGNRFNCPGGVDLTIAAGGVTLQYLPTAFSANCFTVVSGG